MPKYIHKNIKVFGGNSSNTGTFGSAQAGSGVLTTDIESMQSLPAWENGMASATIGGQKLLPQEEMEAALRVATYGLANIYQDGIPVYDSLTTYYTTSIVRQDNTTILYRSLVDNNVGNLLTDNTKWQELGDLSLLGTGYGTCSTASATAAKTITLNNPIVDNAHFYCTFTNANTSSTITLNANSNGNWNIYDLKGNQITGTYFSNAANETCLFKIDKTNSRFILITAPFWQSRMAMPSSIYIDLTLGASGSTYTAPKDGWIFFDRTSDASEQFIAIGNVTTSLSTTIYSSATSQSLRTFAPIKKGDIFNTYYSAGGVTNAFRFVYTEGSKP